MSQDFQYGLLSLLPSLLLLADHPVAQLVYRLRHFEDDVFVAQNWAAMKGPALWPRPFLVAWVRSVRATGSAPMWAVKILMTEPSVRGSA